MRLDGPGKNSYPTDGVVKGIMDFPEIWYISITTLAASFCQISSFSPPRNKSYKPPHLKAVIIEKKSEKFPLPPTHSHPHSLLKRTLTLTLTHIWPPPRSGLYLPYFWLTSSYSPKLNSAEKASKQFINLDQLEIWQNDRQKRVIFFERLIFQASFFLFLII